MNREIKFRGWNKKNGTWLYGFYLQNRGEHFVCPDELATGKVFEDYEVDLESVGQFTGLRDKNGKEIYEGDIIRFCKGQKKDKSGHWVDDTEDRVVIWPHCGFSISDLSKCEDSIEVIGNIYENPELLKQEQQ